MTSQAEHEHLCFVTWNTNGIKNKMSEVLNSLSNLQADIVFLQETHVGPECYKIFEKAVKENWHVFFTIHSPISKGVAILIKNDVPFEYICHDEDCSGGYIVLFCYLHGELYTLVNVYNHKEDRIVLGRLKEYLMETAEGVLVVGGDFNTVLDPSLDRKPSTSRPSPFRAILEDFSVFLNLQDTWSYKYPTEEGFTRRQNESYSRIDKFFLSKDTMGRVYNIEVESKKPEVNVISDHYPLLLKFTVQMQTEPQKPRVATLVEDFKEYTPDIRPGKISGAEILSAIMSLPDTDPVRDYKTHCCPLTETLKIKYNKILTNQPRPGNSKHSEDRLDVENLIFLEILAKRLSAFISLETNCDIGVIVTFERSQQEIKWSFLKTIFQELYDDYAGNRIKQTHSAPPPEFSILDHILPKVQNSELRSLQPDCPLTNAILNMTLRQLENTCTKKYYRSTVFYLRQTLHIHVQQDSREEVVKLVEKFKYDSGIRLFHEIIVQ